MSTIDYNDPANCIFCKIVSGAITADIIYEDDAFLGFLDLHPVSQGHTLVIPKKHFRWVHDVEPFCDYWQSTRKIMRHIEAILKPEWVQYHTHGEITHAHIHIIPRYDNVDGPDTLPQSDTSINRSALQKMAQLLDMR